VSKSPPILCPSSPLETQAVLVGVVLSNGRIAYAADRLEVDEGLEDALREAESPERLFRFASPCRQTGCVQWTGERCGVIDRAMNLNPQVAESDELPDCSIRSECRWFFQSGREACSICPYIITDSRPGMYATP
jgi:hypothetical protein